MHLLELLGDSHSRLLHRRVPHEPEGADEVFHGESRDGDGGRSNARPCACAAPKWLVAEKIHDRSRTRRQQPCPSTPTRLGISSLLHSPSTDVSVSVLFIPHSPSMFAIARNLQRNGRVMGAV